MASQRTSSVDVLPTVARFIPVLAILLAAVSLAQTPAAGWRHVPSARSTPRNTNAGASDTSIFSPAVSYPTGGYWASRVAVADMNGDGKPDLVVANCAPPGSTNCNGKGSVGVLLGNGDGTFQASAIYDSGGYNARFVAVADVNGDGKPDVIVTNFCLDICPDWSGLGGISVLLGNGDGTLQPAVAYGSGGYWAEALTIADVNGDGKPDLIVANRGSYNIAILLGNGDGTFQPAMILATLVGPPYSVAVADVNGDGRLDLVVAVGCQGSNCGIAVFLGNGDGTFQAPTFYDSGGQMAFSVTAADVNGDGRLDLVVANYFSQTAGVLLGNGDGTFQPAVTYDTGAPAGSNLTWVAAADVSSDGFPDLLATNYLSGTVGVLLGNGDGTFQPVVTYDTGGTFLSSVVPADLNGDGKPDLAVAGFGNYGSGAVAVMLNNSPYEKPTTTALVSSHNPSGYGQVVSFTVTVTSSAGIPSGTVQILSGSIVVGSGTLTGGTVSIPVSTLPAGTDSIIASYLGGNGYAASKSAPLSQTVTQATTTTTLVSSLNPAATNQNVSFTATVTSQYGAAVTGSVTFNSGSQTLGTASLSGSVAILTTSFSTAGTYSVTAKYSGDSNNLGSTSAVVSQKIIAATTTTLTSSLNPSVVGQAVTFTATVTSSGGIPPNGEVVTFYKGSAVLGTAALSGGIAALTTSSLAAGVFTMTASYPGDSGFAASTSAGLKQTVNSTTKSATSTTFTSSLNPSTYGQKVTFTATVTTTGSVPPTGYVSFTWGGGLYTIGWGKLNSSGVATLTKSNLNADPYALVAKYGGDANNLSNSSPVVNQTVLQTTSSATLTASPNPSSVGQAVTFTAQITSPTVTPTGPVTFAVGNTVLGTAQLSNTKATFTTTTLSAGSTVVTATYYGDSNIAKSSASVTQVVQP